MILDLATKIKIGLLIAAFFCACGFAGFFYYQGKTACETATVVRTVTKTITIKEKQDEILNHKPTSNGVINRLLTATF